ncbi:Alpha/beta hydrolase family-domain-containing protein [Lasiosphaeris hirsuta]|uniref:Alpha/beta hydrolase family-domain-containing protein n=1 Tax=Lasiosphaeris hirsuta TaxID=260670 RepID=A0AA39ZPH0_9PEZI|nr:Alpha/beta hydrolase family-domain-containing protein [Lasiosphaeris hirsuta]
MASILVALVVAALSIKKGKASPTANTRSCVEIEVPVSIDTTAIQWLQPRVDSNIDAVDWVTYQTTRTSPNITQSMIGQITVKKTFKINGQLCVPQKSSAKYEILQLATHGGGFDKRYWDADIKPKEYSYVEAALAEGYSIFTYDRLGTGRSDKPDAYDIIQLNVQVEILRQLTSIARSGKLVSASKKLSGSLDDRLVKYKPSKIVHVGHSIGSILSVGLVTNYPTESDGLIATGFLPTNIPLPSLNIATWGFEFARENSPGLFKDHGSGFIVQATKSNVQISFLKKGTFEPTLLDYAWKIRQPIAVSEFLSLATAFGTEGAKFKGPVQFVIGENDYGSCGGDCNGTYDLDMIKQTYPVAKIVGVHIQPGTGHGLTLSMNATAGYKASFDFLQSSGL